MLFTSPVFLFLFLPLMVISYLCIPKKHRQKAILVYNIAFYVLANHRLPINILLMAAVILLTYIAGEIVSVKRQYKVIALFCSLLLFTLFLVRTLGSLLQSTGYDYYPLGASVYMLAAISYINDVYRGDAKKASLPSLVTYISFFPVLICGPFIKYKDFIELTSADALCPTQEGISSGMILFAFGFIKRIGISAVLTETYEKLFLIGKSSFSVFLLLIVSSLTFLSVFFAFSGYSDMATGICKMLGIKIDGDLSNFFVMITSPRRYFSNFIGSLGEWMRDYVKDPLELFLTRHATHKTNKKLARFISSFTWTMCMGAWFKSHLNVLFILLPIALLTGIEEAFFHERKRMRSRVLYPISAFVNFFVIIFLWSFMKDGGFDTFIENLAGASFSGHKEQLYEMLTALFSGKTLLSFASATFCLAFSAPKIRLFIRNASSRGGVLVRGISAVCILAVFFACIMLYLPQYPLYATVPFKHFAT